MRVRINHRVERRGGLLRMTGEFVSLAGLVTLVSLSILFGPASTSAQNATTAGDITTPYPTIIHLAVEWKIRGDDNLNGVVTVQFRETGQNHWREGLSLRRVPAGQSRGTHPIFSWENKHSGSLFDLKPDTEYEIRLKLNDPDGGSVERMRGAAVQDRSSLRGARFCYSGRQELLYC